LAQGLYDIAPLEPLIERGYTLLTPNYRLARRIKAEWDARRMAAGDRVWQPLPVQPLESWLLGQWELAVNAGLVPPVVPIGAGQALELWRQVIIQQELQSPDYHLLRPAAAAELASQARDTLYRWQVNIDSAAVRQIFELDRDCGTFLHWLTQFERRLAASGLCTVVDCLAQLPPIAVHLPASRVVLLEIGELPPLIRTGLQSLSAEVLEIDAQAAPGERRLHPCSDKREELQTVAAWAAGLHCTAPTATIGIVLSDMAGDRVALEYLLRREFDCLGDSYNTLPVNFSTGIALAEAPLVRDALAALAMGLQYTTVPAVVGLLRSRFLDIPDAHSALAQRLVLRLYTEGQQVLSLSDLRDVAANLSTGDATGLVLGQRLLALYRMQALRRRARPSLWVGHFREVLSLWGWPGAQPLDSLEFQQLELWDTTLDEYGTYDAVCEPIDFSNALQLLRECCSRQISQPQTADSPVQVLGPLEAAGLSFEHLWLCGMQGASWPAAPRPNPFIPLSLQTQLQMPHATAEREWAFGEALIQQYARSSKVLHASFCRQVDGVPDLVSALLQDFTCQAMPEPPMVATQWSTLYKGRVLEEVPDQSAPLLGAEQQSSVGGGSSVLEDQSQCPFRAFARHRLRVEPLGEFSLGLSAADRGSLLHAALFALWGEICDSASLHALSDAQQQRAIERAVQAAVSAMPARRRHAAGKACLQLEEQRLVSVLQEWLAVEHRRSAFSVVQREQEITVEIAGLCMQLRVDRVDQLPDRSRVIIDYKSGRCTVQDWLGDRPARPQLLLYGSAEHDTVAALAFAQVRARDCRYVGLGQVAAADGIGTDIARAVRSQMKAGDWPSLNDRWREILERIATAFVAGAAQVDPLTPSTCTRCGLQPLCRVGMCTAIQQASAE
jgi:ATP-dependent helicase/nuclease subunit B